MQVPMMYNRDFREDPGSRLYFLRDALRLAEILAFRANEPSFALARRWS
jgi:hypothetical protein